MVVIYAGHANVQTDIKEAIFLGPNDDLVAAGSDDGNVFIYDAKTGQIVRVLPADADVANCVQAGPSLTYLCCVHWYMSQPHIEGTYEQHELT